MFDPAKAAELVGKRVLVGLTIQDRNGRLIERRQFLGLVVTAEEDGIVLNMVGTDENVALPPDTGAFRKAEKGDYRMRASGERVVNPDYLTSWTMTARPYTGEDEG